MKLARWDPFDIRPFMSWPNIFDEDSWTDNRGLDVYETKDKVIVKASVAGIKPEDVDITFEKGVLWIKAQQKEEEKEGKKYYHKSFRSYSYKVAIPSNVDYKNEPEAEVDDGILTIAFAKSELSKPKKIQIKTKNK